MRVLVTGGASGLGEVITRRFCSTGDHTVYFTFSKSRAASAEIVAQYPCSEAIACDFTDEASLVRLLARLSDLDIDVLVNNALASMQTSHFHKSDYEGFLTSFEVNVMPTLRVTQQAIKRFRKKKSGKIITVLSSYVVNRPPVGLSEYVANKAYLQSLSRSWAVENARLNITANCVSPSMMRTALTAGVDERQIEAAAASKPLGSLVTPDDVAEAVLFLAQAGPHINGVNMLVNSGDDMI